MSRARLARRVLGAAPALLALAAAPAAAQVSAPTAVLTDPAGVAGDGFGHSIALDGDRALVGAPSTDDLASNAGAAFVLERDPSGAWPVAAELVAAQPIANGRLGNTVALDGDVALCADLVGNRVHVFERAPGGTWSETAVLAPPTGRLFTPGIDVDGDRIAVGVRALPASRTPGGVAVFERSGASWSLAQFVDALDGAVVEFARRLDLAGDRIVVGSPHDSRTLPSNGVIMVFERSGGSWSRTDLIEPPFPAFSQLFGYDVVTFDDTIVAGVLGASFVTNCGAVAVIEKQAGSWTTLYVNNQTPQIEMRLGASVDAIDGRIVAAAPGFETNFGETGAIFVFEKSTSPTFINGVWYESLRLLPETASVGDGLGALDGNAVALDGLRVLAGARGASGTGEAYVLDLERFHTSRNTASIVDPGVHRLTIRGEVALENDVYFVAGSVTGTSPGIALAPGVALPLVQDSYTFACATLAAPLIDQVGTLDDDGRGVARLTLAPGLPASFLGTSIHHAFVAIDPTDFSVEVSNAVSIEFVP